MSWWVIRTVAKKEAKTNLRSPSFLSIALLLLILNFAVISFSVSFSGFEGQADPRAMLLSLINLQMYIVPLLALIVSYDGLLRERELGTLDLLLSYPLEFSDMVIGKWLGFSAVLGLAIILGFLLPAYRMFGSGIPPASIAGLVALSVWLGIVFNSLGLLFSSLSRDRTFVIASCIILWLFFVLLFDLGFVGLAIATDGVATSAKISWVLLLSPTDVFRLVSLMTLMPQDTSSFYGLGVGALQLPVGISMLLVWTLAPLALAIRMNPSKQRNRLSLWVLEVVSRTTR
ncbi:MAG: ABC transporter permease subunit [Myxococcota bacterium]|jgi:Cu-processing system permease protein|nr:hypothetical protein [Deltaproteobacteria bacterium]MCP4243787.1 ABC transporter permease subunit [bacterium]MDP7073272.1 ABC transporter permease subunit [Myxococcota bacterium]MDP7300807.1 ABC transporter permease subunit [Myxococcota bacterium]MDP7433120.1 ABC transporter permease subunit [Myxococcota bacterium]